MSTQILKMMLGEIGSSIDIPDSSYETAYARYKDLGKWLGENPKSKSARFKPHVFAQGSFRLGTVIKPWKRNDYDLDLSCKLQYGVTKENYTQEQLKKLIGADLEAYRIENHIEEALEPRHRCWRLIYQDHLNFHLDTVPCIPENELIRGVLQERMVKAGAVELFAKQIAQLAVSITDDRKESYRIISPEWNISNPEGYAQWFEARMKQAKRLFESIIAKAKDAKVDPIPAYQWRTPLQRCIQILKRHRDIMFEKDLDGQPISAIITTLAARSYQGEEEIVDAMQTILTKMGGLVNKNEPRVPNPVNPAEDFADKWPTDKGRELKLEEKFWYWLEKAREDFGTFSSSSDIQYLTEKAKNKFGADLNVDKLKKGIGLASGIVIGGKGLADQMPTKAVDHRGGGRFG
jgi:hypothetical protein